MNKIILIILQLVLYTAHLSAQALNDAIKFKSKGEEVYIVNTSTSGLVATVKCEKQSSMMGEFKLHSINDYILISGKEIFIGKNADFPLDYKYSLVSVRPPNVEEQRLIMDQIRFDRENQQAEEQIKLAEQQKAEEQRIAEAKRLAELEERKKEDQKRIDTENQKTNGANFRLRSAIESDNLSNAKKALAEKADIFAVFEEGRNLLFSLKADAAIAELLLENGVNAKAKDHQGFTPLHFAKSSQIVEKLIKYGAEINALNNAGLSPLNQALLDQRIEVIKRLVLLGADVKSCKELLGFFCDSDNKSPDLDFIRILLDKGGDPNASSDKYGLPLGGAIKSENMDLIRLLLSKGANLKKVKQYYYGYPTSNKELKKFLRDAE